MLIFGVGRLYKKTPRFSEIPSLIGQLLINAISINSGYTSRIVVGTRCRYRKVTSIRIFDVTLGVARDETCIPRRRRGGLMRFYNRTVARKRSICCNKGQSNLAKGGRVASLVCKRNLVDIFYYICQVKIGF